ncbi:MAG: hypothetical protein EA425_16775, partial [Puniceicoccaceae bacterium]
TPQHLPQTPDDNEHFNTHGWVVVKGCLSKEVTDWSLRHCFDRLGYDPADSSTWKEARIHMPNTIKRDCREFAPKLWNAVCQVLGGEERIHEPYTIGDGYIVNLREGADQPWREPGPECPGWHKDGDFFRHFLDSPEQGLLTIVAWTEMRHRGGATLIAPDSIGVVARYFAEHPEGLLPREIETKKLIARCSEFMEAVADAGDVYLLHPYMLHAVSQNHLGVIRIITNPPAHLKEPMKFDREDPADFSPVERAVLRGLGVDRFRFKPTGQRERVVPERVKRQQAMLEEEKRRAAAGS